jgi:lantibiotic modifying enzyme
MNKRCYRIWIYINNLMYIIGGLIHGKKSIYFFNNVTEHINETSRLTHESIKKESIFNFCVIGIPQLITLWLFSTLHLLVNWQRFNVESVSDCCLTPTQQFFSYIMARTSWFQWDDVRFVLDQHVLVGFL